jgi:hypothetical protein
LKKSCRKIKVKELNCRYVQRGAFCLSPPHSTSKEKKHIDSHKSLGFSAPPPRPKKKYIADHVHSSFRFRNNAHWRLLETCLHLVCFGMNHALIRSVHWWQLWKERCPNFEHGYRSTWKKIIIISGDCQVWRERVCSVCDDLFFFFFFLT